MRILITGGGIGGLAAALSLGSRGHEVTVLEQRPTFVENVSGIQIGPHSFHALDRLGVGRAVLERSLPITECHFMDGATGEPMGKVETRRRSHRFGRVHATALRLDLYEPLLNACWEMDTVWLRGQSRVVRHAQDADSVTVELDSGERLTGDVLIGADGVHSAIRDELTGGSAPTLSGHTLYRTLVPIDLVPDGLREDVTTLWAGLGWHIVHFPVGDGGYVSLSAMRRDTSAEPMSAERVDAARVLAAFPDAAPVARGILAMGEHWHAWSLYDGEPATRWADGRIALLGDAAHPTRWRAAQSLRRTLEEAVALGDLLDRSGRDVRGWLAAYDARRARHHATASVGAPLSPLRGGDEPRLYGGALTALMYSGPDVEARVAQELRWAC
ncbi:FAD-dependent monooxygenase [Streptomyces sp. SP18CS02]|uniref:FAD-dependent monooxygenase n=1 Tax=Streptomyces sp. SP18CS02 TaxID=3002531 RepID=UPI002E79E375|nr:FAD-dependent monooxygenase [Streptomyces sp. SP18CS02]MEE1756460.1 FAD-dependent monooxygenase [Streptomyces sp. SP18CS02]